MWNTLTGVGGRIFAETILALLFKDNCSYLNTPTCGSCRK